MRYLCSWCFPVQLDSDVGYGSADSGPQCVVVPVQEGGEEAAMLDDCMQGLLTYPHRWVDTYMRV